MFNFFNIEENSINKLFFQDPECFQCAVGYPLAVAQYFGLFPLFGVLQPSPTKLKFKQFAPRTIYAYILLISSTFMASLSVVHMFQRLNSDTFSVQGINLKIQTQFSNQLIR